MNIEETSNKIYNQIGIIKLDKRYTGKTNRQQIAGLAKYNHL